MESSLTIFEGTQFIFSYSFFSMLEVILTQSPCHADTQSWEKVINVFGVQCAPANLGF